MPQATPLAIKDGAATPVTHNFVPGKVNNLTAAFSSQAGSTVLATRETLEVKLREGSADVAPKVTIKLVAPVEGQKDGQMTALRQYLGGVDFVIAPNGTREERSARRVMLANLLLDPSIAKVIDDVESFY